MKKVILFSLLSTLLVVTTSITSANLINNYLEKNKEPTVVDDHQFLKEEHNIGIRFLNKFENSDGTITQTFSYQVLPSNSSYQDVKVSVKFNDDSDCSDCVTATVDTSTKIISVNLLRRFDCPIILTITSISNPSVYASIQIDCLQEFPQLQAKPNIDYSIPFEFGDDLNGEETQELNVDNQLHLPDLFYKNTGTFTISKNYIYSGINYSRMNVSVVDYSSLLSENTKELMCSAVEEKFFTWDIEKTNWSKELIWNLVDSDTYRTELYTAMKNYDYEDCNSYILVEFEDLDLIYQDEEENEKVCDTIDSLKFRINITSDYSSLITEVSNIVPEVSNIYF